MPTHILKKKKLFLAPYMTAAAEGGYHEFNSHSRPGIPASNRHSGHSFLAKWYIPGQASPLLFCETPSLRKIFVQDSKIDSREEKKK